MKITNFRLSWLAVLFSPIQGAAAPNPGPVGFEPTILKTIEDLAIDHLSTTSKPGVVVIDLDDTLIDTRYRTANLLRDFAKVATESGGPTEATLRDKLAAIRAGQAHYDLGDTFKELGVDSSHPDFNASLVFWKTEFFSSSRCADDVAFAGAQPGPITAKIRLSFT